MREYEHDSPNSSSRVIWFVAGVAGLLLLAWAGGWLPFDFGGTQTGHLASDPLADEFEALERHPFENLPEQTEPAPTEIVDVPPASDEDPWSLTDPETDDVPAVEPAIETAGFEPPAPEFDETMFEEEPHRVAKPGNGDGEIRRTASIEPAGDAPLLDLATIERMIKNGEIAEAHTALSRIWFEHPAARETIRRGIDTTARAIFFDPQPHFLPVYVVRSGDTLAGIGKSYDVPWQYVVRLNRVDPRTIRPGDELKVVRGPFDARVDLSDFTLTVHNRGLYVKQYGIGIGREGRTPVGTFTVREKVVNPSYTDPDGRVIPGDDPRNPIGERWLSLGKGYGIHGTLDRSSIGREASAGCIRLSNADVAELFDLLGPGSEVVVVE